MEIYRVPPYPMSVTYEGFTPSTEHFLTLLDSRTGFVDSASATSDVSGNLTFVIPDEVAKYDEEYSATIYEGSDDTGSTVGSDNLNIVRPYLVPANITPAGEDVNDYIKYERIARLAIDNIVGGFYYKDFVLDLQGMGSDKLVLGRRINFIDSVVANNELVYDSSEESNEVLYTLTPDKQSMIVHRSDAMNIVDGRAPTTIPAPSDYGQYIGRTVDFPVGYNYTVRVDSGWAFVPQDIKEATQLLIDDMACGAPNYLNKYVREYETKDYRIDIHRPAFAGTGNLIVDQTLEKYKGDTLYDGVRVL